MKKLLKFRIVDTDFSSNQENASFALNILFVWHNSEEINLAFKSSYNKRNKQVILLMINYEDNNCYYFAVKDLLELSSLGRLRAKKEGTINN